MSLQRTFSILKPDCTARNLTGAVNALIMLGGNPVFDAPREALKPRLAELQAALDGVQALADRRMSARRRRTIGAS